MKFRLATVILIILLSVNDGFAQSETTTQFWWDATYYRPFAVSFRKILSVGTRHLLGSNDWNKIFVKPSVEWYPTPFVDVMAELVYLNTKQTNDINTVELRPDIGFRLNFYQQRWILRTNTRFELRNVRYMEIGEVERTLRFRSRVEVVYPITNPSHRDPKTLYGLTDFEVFADLAGDEIDERFSNRTRFRLGAGWRQDLEWRLELVYTFQNSRNTLGEEFSTSDNIIRVRLKYQPLRGNTKKEIKDQPHH
jgi:hypothetical protein